MERDSLGGPDHGWYIAEPDGTTFGPFSRSEFAAQRTRAGYSAQALAWHVDFSEWRPLARVAVSAQSRAGEASRELFKLEARYQRADGAWRWLQSHSQPRCGSRRRAMIERRRSRGGMAGSAICFCKVEKSLFPPDRNVTG